jgi:hypothetical protein
MIGTQISARIAKARWAWSELTSPRFAHEYPPFGPDAVRLQSTAKGGARFDDLPESDKDTLVSLIARRQPGFMQDIAGVKEFICEAWSRDDLMKTITIRAMSPSKTQNILYSDFIKNPPHLEGGKPEWSDPRHSGDSWPANKPFSQDEPGIAIIHNGHKILVDGYGRSVIFVRHGKPDEKFLVWVPAS